MRPARYISLLVMTLMVAGCVATKTRDFAVTPFYSGKVTDALTGEPLPDVLVHVVTLRRVPSNAVTVTTDGDGKYRAGVLGQSAWSVTLAAPVEEICYARITFLRAGYGSHKEEDAGPCTKAPRVLDVALLRSE